MIDGAPARHLAAVGVAVACLLSACAPGAPSASPPAPPASDQVPTPSMTPLAGAPDATSDPTPVSPAPTAPPDPRAPIAPPGSIITADIRDDDGLVARLRTWSPDGLLIGTLEAPFVLEDGWFALSPVVAGPDGRLAIYVARKLPDEGEAGGVDGTAVVDVVDPEPRPSRCSQTSGTRPGRPAATS